VRSRLTKLATADIDVLLRQTDRNFGARQFEIYVGIIDDGVALIASDPLRPSSQDRSQIRPGVRSFHLERVRNRRRSATHVIYYTISATGEGEVVVLRVLHEAMEPKRRLASALRADKNDVQ
jgi:toxin ParE1/3/4